ncbi:uncharacterized protein LOC125523858 [Triticum urartu]|nr:uncharacterized protein LOC125523858 [Triticum urartu]
MHVRLHATRYLHLPPAVMAMASSTAARHPPLLVLVLIIVVLLLSSSPAIAAAGPPSASAGQGFHVATTPLHDASVAKNGAGRRPVGGGRRRRADRGGGTGAWAFSAMLPRGFVPPSGSSACHNDMPATAADDQYYTCGGSVRP